MGILQFLKNNQSKKERKIYDEPITKFESLTVRTIANALKLIDDEKLENEKLKKHTFKEVNLTIYNYQLNEKIHIEVTIAKHVNSVIKCDIVLENGVDLHYLFSLKNGLSLEQNDKEIKWKKRGFWCETLEAKIQSIFETCYQRKEERKRKEKASNAYFTEKFKDVTIPEEDILLKYQRVYYTLENAEKVGFVTHDKVMVKGYEANRFKSGPFVAIMPSHNDSNITLLLEENGHEQIIYCGGSSVENGMFTLEKNKMTYAFWLFLNELPEKTEKRIEEMEQAALLYFTKRYRIKSLKY